MWAVCAVEVARSVRVLAFRAAVAKVAADKVLELALWAAVAVFGFLGWGVLALCTVGADGVHVAVGILAARTDPADGVRLARVLTLRAIIAGGLSVNLGVLAVIALLAQLVPRVVGILVLTGEAIFACARHHIVVDGGACLDEVLAAAVAVRTGRARVARDARGSVVLGLVLAKTACLARVLRKVIGVLAGFALVAVAGFVRGLVLARIALRAMNVFVESVLAVWANVAGLFPEF